MDEKELDKYLKEKSFEDFLNAARAMGIQQCFARLCMIVDAIDDGLAAQKDSTEDAKLIREQVFQSIRASFAFDYEKFANKYAEELKMGQAVLSGYVEQPDEAPIVKH
jgi:hypothetical protein